jgi:hypothetical protein
MIQVTDFIYPAESLGINLPKVNFLLLLSIGVVLYLTLFSPDFAPKKVWSIKKSAEDEEVEEKREVWSASWVHFFIGGVAVPKLISFIGALGFIQIIAWFFIKSSESAPGGMVSWFEQFFLDTKAVGAQIFQMIFFYIGLWVGVPFSLDTLRRIYAIKEGRPIIIRSFVLFLGFGALSGFYSITAKREDFFLSNDFNLIDLLARTSLFLALTKWYMYRVVIVRKPEKVALSEIS